MVVVLVLLQNLEYLKLSYNYRIKDKNLQFLTNLKTLKIAGPNISGKYFNNLKNLKNLKYRSYYNNKFKEEYLNDLIYLEKLTIKDTDKFTGQYLNKFTNLTKLNASNTKINEKYLSEITKLKKLNLSKCCNISGNCFKYLTLLQKLDLTGVSLMTERHLNNLINLTELKIENCNIYFGEFLLQMNDLNVLLTSRSLIDLQEKQISEIKLLIAKGSKFNEAVMIVLNNMIKEEGLLREDVINEDSDDDEDAVEQLE
ncbi:hypothetical protein ABK040_014428 [Willaertia magna]